ncbi:MAG TPA: amidohydrolase family protein, partial [bacterium]|nr:amidohydrolase family protein [bacterium]
MADYIIKNGTVIDGTGKKRFRADVVITGDKIETVEHIGYLKGNSYKVIDARNKIVCPGFVDPHSHADLTIYRKDSHSILAPLVRQGITTFVGGNCGMSLAPVNDEYHDDLKLYIEAFTAKDFEKEIKWQSFGEFLNLIEKNGMPLNYAPLAPHGLIRICSMGRKNRYARDSEIKTMCNMLEDSIEGGAIGLSSGLQYMPGLNSETRELAELGKVLKKHEGIYTSHLRSYMNTLPQAIDELISIARSNNIRAQISHIFWVPDLGIIGPIFQGVMRGLIDLSKFWTPPLPLDTEIQKQLDRLDRLRKRGVNIGMDVMPTTTTFTHLFAYFPPWAVEGPRDLIYN